MPSPLFSPTRAGAIDLATRIVMAPLTRNRAPGATPTPLMARTINGVPLSILFLLLALVLIVIAMLIAVVRKKRD